MSERLDHFSLIMLIYFKKGAAHTCRKICYVYSVNSIKERVFKWFTNFF